MKKFHILLSFLIIFLVSARPQAALEQDAIFNKVSKTYTLNADGSMNTRIVKQVKLLTYNAFHRLYGETFIVYNPEFQKLKINACYTIMKDGKKVVTPSNAFNEVLPRFAANAPVYNKLREMVVTHTGLEIGATIFLDYEILTNKDYFPAFMGSEALYENSPVEDYEVSLQVPVAVELRYKLSNGGQVAETKSEANGKRVISWKFKNVPAYLPEGFQPKEAAFLPTLEFTSFKNNSETIASLAYRPGFQLKCDEKMRAAVKAIREQYKIDDLRTALKIQEMVVNDLALYPVPIVYTGYRCRTPIEVWNSGGGNELEKAMLFIALLSSANISSHLATIVPPGNHDRPLVLSSMESFMVYFNDNQSDGLQFLSVTSVDDQNRSMKLYDKHVWGFEQTPDVHVDYNYTEGGKSGATLPGFYGTSLTTFGDRSDVEMNIEASIDTAMTANGNVKLWISGACSPYYDLVKDENKAASLLKGSFGEGKNVNVSQLRSVKNFVEMELSREKALKQQGSYYFMEIPWCSKGVASWHLPEMTAFRMNPFEIPFPIEEKYTIDVKLPEGLTLVSKELNKKINNSAGKMVFILKQKGDKLQITKSLELWESTREETYYEDLRTLLNAWQSEACRKLVFRR